MSTHATVDIHVYPEAPTQVAVYNGRPVVTIKDEDGRYVASFYFQSAIWLHEWAMFLIKQVEQAKAAGGDAQSGQPADAALLLSADASEAEGLASREGVSSSPLPAAFAGSACAPWCQLRQGHPGDCDRITF